MTNLLPILSTGTGERLFTIIRGMLSKKRIKEDRFFKNNFKVYVATHYSTHIEIWSHNTRVNCATPDKSLLLGKIIKGKLEKPKDFYHFPWDVQRSAEKIFRMFKV